MAKIALVGVGASAGLGLALAKVLKEASHELIAREELCLQERPELPDLRESVRLTPSETADGWYQRFAGKRGKAPRY